MSKSVAFLAQKRAKAVEHLGCMNLHHPGRGVASAQAKATTTCLLRAEIAAQRAAAKAASRPATPDMFSLMASSEA